MNRPGPDNHSSFSMRYILSRKRQISAGEMQRMGLVLVLNFYCLDHESPSMEEIHCWVHRHKGYHPGLFAAFELSYTPSGVLLGLSLFLFSKEMGYDLFMLCWDGTDPKKPRELLN